MARPSMAIIVTFVGRAPLWLPAFLLSCRHNQDVRWLIYSDMRITLAVPANVTLRRLSLDALSRRASEVLGEAIELTHPRKLNDLKPAYGLIFADDLQPYDFWAWSDLDIVWGEIRRFVTDEMLSSYDIISSRKNRTSGHFTLFRNTVPFNRAFLLIPNFAEALAEPQHINLDERELTHHLRAHLARQSLNPSPRVYWSENLTIDTAYQKTLRNNDGDSLWWRNGRTFDAAGKEFMYLHFHKLKKKMKTINFSLDDAPASFRINRSGFSA